MLFNSLSFLLFLPAVVITYYLTPVRWRWSLLLLASYFFYAYWEPSYLLLIWISTLWDYSIARLIPRFSGRAKGLLLLSVLLNLGLLGFFKYYGFAASSLETLIGWTGATYSPPIIDVLLPVGISFYTFQTMAYTIDVYRGQVRPEKHLGYFALYVCFFPQLVAGPIERFDRLGPQLRQRHLLNWQNLRVGMQLILAGLFYKMVLADNIGLWVDEAYGKPDQHQGAGLFLAFITYPFQIYGDFFGYSLVAIGSARMLGIRLMDNFNTPYFSASFREFWSRWHISLSTWFRDYLYLSMGGNRVGRWRWMLNIGAVFLLSGLWHGANWTFVGWGAGHAVGYLIESRMPKVRFPRWGSTILVFILVSILWVLFRAADYQHAVIIFTQLFAAKMEWSSLMLGAILAAMLTLFMDWKIGNRVDDYLRNKNYLHRWAVYAVFLAGIYWFAAVSEEPFIYFQF